MGCLVSNIMGMSVFIALVILGSTIGGWIDGDEGARKGFIIGGILALLYLWRGLWWDRLRRRR
jgi:membrane protein DedA with SNARE-associated domain